MVTVSQVSAPRLNTAHTLAAGAAAGALATVAMSGVMLGLQRAGLLGRMPPRHIVEHALARVGLRRSTSRPTRKALGALAHLGFGASQGAIYALGHRTVTQAPGSRGPTSLSAVPFALAVWATSYAGWIPAFGILPPPSQDRPGRPTSMVLSHVVYGIALAGTLRRLLKGGKPTRASRHAPQEFAI